MAAPRPRLNALMYHGIEAGPARGRYSFSIGEFRDHLRAIDELVGRAPSAGAEVEDLSGFALTFDDGSEGWLEAAEALRERGWSAFFFVITGEIGKRGRLGPSDVRRLSALGHVIGSHSADHPAHFAFQEDAYILDQWKRSKAELEAIIGREVTSASVPGGDYSERVARAAEAAGLRRLFTSEPVARGWDVGACRVLGRFALRRGMRSRTVARLAAGARPEKAARYLEWNAKKSVKKLLAWPLAALASRERGG